MFSSRSTALFSALLLLMTLGFFGCTSNDGAPTEGDSADVAHDSTTMSGQQTDPVAASSGDLLAEEKAAVQMRRARVTQLMNKADAAANAGRHEEAKGLYREALDWDIENQSAARGYESMVKILAGTQEEQEGDFDASVARQQAAQVQAARHFNEGLRARAEGRLDDSVKELEKAYQLLKYNESPVASDLTPEFVKRVLDEVTEYADREERRRQQNEREELAKIQRDEEERERLRVVRRKQALWENLIETMDREEYARAERIADAIIELDYRDANAHRVKESARRARHALARERHIENYREEWNRIHEEVKMAMIPPATDTGFPNTRKWREIASRGPIQISRGAIEEETEADRTVHARLAGTVLPRVDWNGKTLPEVVDELRSLANVNIVVTPEGLAKSEDFGELTLEFSQITAKEALASVCAQMEVAYSVENGLVHVQTPEEARRNKVVEFYDVRDLVSPIRSFPGVQLNLNGSGFGGGEEDFEEEDDEPNRAIEMDQLIELIKNAVDPAWDEDDGNRLDPKAGTLIVRQTPDKQRLVRRLLNDLRKNTGVQVSIESRFITVENNFLQDIGVDLRGLGDDSAGIGIAGPGTDNVFDDFGQAGGGFGTPSNPSGLGSGNDSGVFWSNNDGNRSVRSRTENLFDELLGDPTVLDGSGGTSFQFAYLNDIALEAILRAVQKYERINTVTAPKLMVYNTQRAHLMVLNEVSYVKDFDVEIAQAAVIADPIIDKIREGVVLDVRPIVSHDRRYVTLELRPTVATLVRPIRTFTTNLAVGSAVTLQLPELQKQSVNTTVVVPDGGTLLLAGMKFAQEQTLESGVPILRDIPLLSFFFSRTGKYTSLRDLIILLKVEIVILPELEPTGDESIELLK